MTNSNEEDRTDFSPDLAPKRVMVTVPAHTRHMSDGTTQFVPEYTRPSNRGVKQGPHKPKPPRDYKAERERRAQSKTMMPRLTNKQHAAYLVEQLCIPMAFFEGLRMAGGAAELGMVGEVSATITECRSAIADARSFIRRFTAFGGDDE